MVNFFPKEIDFIILAYLTNHNSSYPELVQKTNKMLSSRGHAKVTRTYISQRLTVIQNAGLIIRTKSRPSHIKLIKEVEEDVKLMVKSMGNVLRSVHRNVAMKNIKKAEDLEI